MTRVRWTIDRIAAFVRDWNAGLDAKTLAERYGKRFYKVAYELRLRGFNLKPRGGRPRKKTD